MDLTTRQQIILKTIVERFTMLAEPIGSKSLKDHLDFQVSSATIRNEMACLEKKAFLKRRISQAAEFLLSRDTAIT